MKAWDIIAYAYDAALHCPECTLKHFYPVTELDGLEDSEGNIISPVFASSEDWQGECCDNCFCVLGE
jgi:hypothetical protein